MKDHVHNILKKLHVHRRVDASPWYRRAGFHLKLDWGRQADWELDRLMHVQGVVHRETSSVRGTGVGAQRPPKRC